MSTLNTPLFRIRSEMPASVPQLDARPTGDQEVLASIPAGAAKLFSED